MPRAVLSRYTSPALLLALVICLLFSVITSWQMKREIARQRDYINELEVGARSNQMKQCPKCPTCAPSSNEVGSSRSQCNDAYVHPALHFLNVKADNVFKSILQSRWPKPSPDSLVVEIGSNDGKQALWAAGLGYRVVSFEPAPSGYKRCVALQERSGKLAGKLEFRNVAISNQKGEMHFLDRDVVSRIVNASTPGAVRVRTSVLEEEIEEDIAFLKIDVEGHEMAVLKGMGDMFARHKIEFVLLEFNPTQIAKHGHGGAADILALLHSKGYDLYDMRLWEFQGKDIKHVVISDETRWHRPATFKGVERFFRPDVPATPWGAWTDILAIRKPDPTDG